MARLAWHILVACAVIVALFLLGLHHSPSLTIENWTFPRSLSRLNWTLEGNEKRYQAAIKERQREIARIGGPNMPSIPNPDHVGQARYTIWDFFVPAFSCPFSVYRVGTLGDGGKWVCGFERVVSRPECVVYSIGVDQQSSFEQALLSQSDHCQVYGFDPSASEWGEKLREDSAVNPRAHFFPYKFGGANNHDASPKEYTLVEVMKELGHSFVDILKIDIEGGEFQALRDIIQLFDGEPLPFGQMQIEIHLAHDPKDHMETIALFQEWWTMLEDAGLRAYWKELNVIYANNFRKGPYVIEWSFMNIRGKHALTDDVLPDYP
ncbi:Methyltranfer-dom domain-containing protein [Favolaschia claudopus]|uniref:Methyltranfer-dom domain-containing protein n=1 Tax=Favolaschia claudopus TaxID=2862362 RepID=A0AAW0DUZ8_9AGAR